MTIYCSIILLKVIMVGDGQILICLVPAYPEFGISQRPHLINIVRLNTRSLIRVDTNDEQPSSTSVGSADKTCKLLLLSQCMSTI